MGSRAKKIRNRFRFKLQADTGSRIQDQVLSSWTAKAHSNIDELAEDSGKWADT